MSQRNARQKNKRLMSQPPLLTFEGNQPLSPTNDDPNTSPLASTLPQSSQNSDSERTVSASPNNAPSPPTSPRKRPTIHPIGNKSKLNLSLETQMYGMRQLVASRKEACDKKLDELKDQVAWLVAEVAALRGSNQQCSQSTDRADSHESSGVGLDDLGLNDGTQSPTQAQ
nr:dual specificity protein kinase shkD-like [Ipomoea batatas]